MHFRTDLAAESCQRLDTGLPEGVTRTREGFGSIQIEIVNIEDEKAARLIGKPPGKYTTITTRPFSHAAELEDREIERIAEEIRSVVPADGTVLVVGLGNSDITPDAIGPRTVHQILATRHIGADAAKEAGLPSLRPCAAIAPGVLGQTGIETSEIVGALVADIRPAAVIVVDALAAGSVSRLGNTVQIANSGISPGSGVMNRRKELSRDTLGVPVVSIGVPTVVDAATLVGDLLSEDERSRFEPEGRSMMITPREIDVIISHAGRVLALAINKALHPNLSLEELAYLAG